MTKNNAYLISDPTGLIEPSSPLKELGSEPGRNAVREVEAENPFVQGTL